MQQGHRHRTCRQAVLPPAGWPHDRSTAALLLARALTGIARRRPHVRHLADPDQRSSRGDRLVEIPVGHTATSSRRPGTAHF